MTPEEIQALAEIEAAKQRGDDPFGDNDEDDVVTPEIGIDPALDKVEQEVTSNTPTTYNTEIPADYKAQRSELVSQKATAMKKLMDGELDATEFSVEDARISDALEDLTAQRIRSETLQEANTQTQAAYQQREIQKLINKSKSEVDYAGDAKAQRQFDIALHSVAQDPDNVGLDYAELLGQAHRMVLALRGVASKGQQVADALKERQPQGGKPPVTLRSLPTASTPNANGDMLDQLGRLKGQAYEDAYSKLSPSQKRSLLDME